MFNKNVGFYLNSKVYQEKALEKSKDSTVFNENCELIKYLEIEDKLQGIIYEKYIDGKLNDDERNI